MKNLQSRTKVRLLQSFLLISLSLFFLVNPAYAQGGFAVWIKQDFLCLAPM